ncbi:MAG: thiol:disulfide interchange protein [Ignavibacteria bacterium]|nr:thiol:disulfide interchange protein [Ignavibacteria bacterium]
MKRILFILFVLTNLSFSRDVLTIDGKSNFEKLHAGSELKVALNLKINPEWHINSHKPNDEFLIPTKISIKSEIGLTFSNVTYPKPHDIELGFSDEPVSVFEGENNIIGIIQIPNDLVIGNYEFEVIFEYQACNDQTCLPPKRIKIPFKFELVSVSTPIIQVNSELFQGTELKSEVDEKKNTEDSLINEENLLLSFILIFLGGLALNLTPCVYPLIPITIGFFGGQSEQKTGKLFLLSGLYVLGMAITYSAIGVVTALSGSLFGAALQNPFVLIFIALVLIGLSLSMFGLYEFQLPSSWVAKFGGAKGGTFGALFMGLTMGIVAAPCIGPFVIGLLTFVGAKADVVLGFFMFFVLALGLGMPYLFLGVFSGKIKNLPRSGEWMVAVKKIFGFILVGMALYFILPLLPKNISGYILPVFMTLASLYLLFFDRMGEGIRTFNIFKKVFLTIVVFVGAWFLIPSSANSVVWEEVSEIKFGGQPTIVDFYADWCIPCKELDAITFTDQSVIDESKRFRTLKVDLTNTGDEQIQKMMKRFEIVGVPTVIFFNDDGKEIERITQFVRPAEFLKLMKSVK